MYNVVYEDVANGVNMIKRFGTAEARSAWVVRELLAETIFVLRFVNPPEPEPASARRIRRATAKLRALPEFEVPSGGVS